MTEENSLIPNIYITQYRLRCRLSQIAFQPSICFHTCTENHDRLALSSILNQICSLWRSVLRLKTNGELQQFARAAESTVNITSDYKLWTLLHLFQEH
jgi:hypothetical protein